MKAEAIEYGDRKVYTVASFNRGVATWIERLPSLWVEGEVTELRRQERWQSVFLTLKDPVDGATLAVQMGRTAFDALQLGLADGERVHVYGRPTLYAQKGTFSLRAGTIERVGLGDHLAALERLKRRLADEGLFDDARKRPLPFLPRRIGLVTGNDAAAKRDVLTVITTRFPPARVLVAETLVQGPRAATGIVGAIRALSREPEIDVIVVTRGGGSFEDLLPFSDERLVRAIAECPVPVISAVGHEQDTPLCDLAADVRASTPTMAGKLVVPDLEELTERLLRSRAGLERGARRTLDRSRHRLTAGSDRLRRAPLLLVERKRARVDAAAGRLRALSPQATLERGYAIVRAEGAAGGAGGPGGPGAVLRDPAAVAVGDRVAVQLAAGSFSATVESA